MLLEVLSYKKTDMNGCIHIRLTLTQTFIMRRKYLISAFFLYYGKQCRWSSYEC